MSTDILIDGYISTITQDDNASTDSLINTPPDIDTSATDTPLVYESQLKNFFDGISLAGQAFNGDPTSITAADGVFWKYDDSNFVQFDWQLNRAYSDLDTLKSDIQSGVENGIIQSFQVVDSGTKILGINFTTSGFTVTSGAAEFSFGGRLPTGLSDIFNLLESLAEAIVLLNDTATGNADGADIDVSGMLTILDKYAFTSMSISNGGKNIFSTNSTSNQQSIEILDLRIEYTGSFPSSSLKLEYEQLDAILKLQDFIGVTYTLTGTERDAVIATLKKYYSNGASIYIGDEQIVSTTVSTTKYTLSILGLKIEVEGDLPNLTLGDLAELLRAYQETNIAGTEFPIDELTHLIPKLTAITITAADGTKLLGFSGDMDVTSGGTPVANVITIAGTAGADTINGDQLGLEEFRTSNTSLYGGDDLVVIEANGLAWMAGAEFNDWMTYGNQGPDFFGVAAVTQLPTSVSAPFNIDAGIGHDTLKIESFTWNIACDDLSIDLTDGSVLGQLHLSENERTSVSSVFAGTVSGFETYDISHYGSLDFIGDSSSSTIKINGLRGAITIDGGNGSDILDLSETHTFSNHWDPLQNYSSSEFTTDFSFVDIDSSGYTHLENTATSTGLYFKNISQFSFSDGEFSFLDLYGTPASTVVYNWNTHQVLDNVMQHPEGHIERDLTDYDMGRSISAADALAALKLAVGLNPNSDKEISPYQFIAADVNEDGRVSAADALAILKMAVGIESAPQRAWILIDEGVDLWDETNNCSAVSRDNVDWALIHTDTASSGYTAVLKGDVNGSWSDESITNQLADDYLSNLMTSGIGANEQWWIA